MLQKFVPVYCPTNSLLVNEFLLGSNDWVDFKRLGRLYQITNNVFLQGARV